MNKGFTFVELLITVGVLSLSLPILFGLFFINLKVQSKVYGLQSVKREGDDALTTMGSVVRQYGWSLHSATPPTDDNEVCSTTDSTFTGDLYFEDKNGNTFRFYLDSLNNKIASESAKSPTGGDDETFSLTSNTVKITNWDISCIRTAEFAPPLVNLQFSVSQNTSSERQEDKASLHYQTTIKLRNL